MPKTVRTEAAEYHRKGDHTTALKHSEETNCHDQGARCFRRG